MKYELKKRLIIGFLILSLGISANMNYHYECAQIYQRITSQKYDCIISNELLINYFPGPKKAKRVKKLILENKNFLKEIDENSTRGRIHLEKALFYGYVGENIFI